MKYCPECGSSLSIGSVKFCHNCGKNLWEPVSNSTNNPINLTESLSGNGIFQDIMTEKEELEIEHRQDYSSTTVYNLGV
jgi:hypothetical protein